MNKPTGWELILLIAFILGAAQCSTVSPAVWSVTPAPTHQGNTLSVIFPLETTELAGGQSLRITAYLADQGGRPIVGATVKAELWAPNGSLFATVPGVDSGQGRYLTNYQRLPLQGAAGTWRVVVQATKDGTPITQAERTFKGLMSRSEMYLDKYGFWIEGPDFFSCHARNKNFRDGSYRDGGGYLLQENHCHGHGNSAVYFDVHWHVADWPADETAAIAYVRSLVVSIDHDPDNPGTDLATERTMFQGWPAWRVTGVWHAAPTYGNTPLTGGPVEWTIFRCPDSPHDWLWTLVVTTSSGATSFMDDLRALQNRFECPKRIPG
jgi:hypothetical protein